MSCVNFSVAKSVLVLTSVLLNLYSPKMLIKTRARETTTVILGPASAVVKDATRRMMQVAILGPRLTVACFFVRVLYLFYYLKSFASLAQSLNI